MYQQASQLNLLDPMTRLANLSTTITELSVMIRLYDLYMLKNASAPFDVQSINQTILTLKLLNHEMQNDYSLWSTCHYAYIEKEKVIPTWDLILNAPKYALMNLYDFVDTFINNVIFMKADLLLNQYVNSQVGSTQLTFFLYINGMGDSRKMIQEALIGIGNCKTNDANNLSIIQSYLLAAGIIILFCCFLIVAFFSLRSDSSINYLWEYLRKKIHTVYFDLYKDYSTRINHINPNSDILIQELDTNQYKSSTKMNFRHSFRYLFRFSFIFLLAGGLYLITMLYFFETIQNSLKYRPQLIEILSRMQISLFELTYWTVEYRSENYNYTLVDMYPKANILPDPAVGFSNAISYLQFANNALLQFNTSDLISSKLSIFLFDNVNSSSSILKYGYRAGLNIYNYECYFLVDQNDYNIGSESTMIINDLLELSSNINKEIILTDSFSKNQILGYIYSMIEFVVGSCIILILFYLVYYEPLIKHEIRVIIIVKKLMKIIPSSAWFLERSSEDKAN